MAILFGKTGSRKVFFALAISACLSRHALAADSAAKNSASQTQPSTEVFDIKTKDIPAPDAPKAATSGSEIPPPDFTEFEDDKFINNLIGEDDVKGVKPAEQAAPALPVPTTPLATPATPPAVDTIVKAPDAQAAPPVIPIPAPADAGAPPPVAAEPLKTDAPAVASELPTPPASTGTVPSPAPVDVAPVTTNDSPAPTNTTPPSAEEKPEVTTDSAKSPNSLTPEEKEKYSELKKHLLNFVARSGGKPAQATNEIAAEVKTDAVATAAPETATPPAVATDGAVQSEVKPVETTLPPAPVAQAPASNAPDDFNDFLEPDSKKPAPAKAEAIPTTAPVVAQPAAPAAAPVIAPPAVTPQVAAAPAPVATDIKNEATPKNGKAVDIVAPLPPKKIDEEHLDRIEVAQPEEREKLSDADKAYLQLLNKQREALPADKKLSSASIATLQGISGELAPLKKGSKEPQRIKIEHGDIGEPGKEEDGVIKSQSKMDISVRKIVKGEDLEKSKVKLGRAYKALLVGQNAAAISIYKEVLDKEPKNKDAMFGLATAYHKNNQYEQAREIYTQILKKDPADKEALNNFLVLVAEEAPEDALIELEKLERINSNFSPIAAQIAMINLKLGHPEKAARYLRRAILLSPDNLSYKYNLAVVYDKAGKEEQALPLYRQVVEAANNGGTVPGSVDKITARMNYLQKKVSEKE